MKLLKNILGMPKDPTITFENINLLALLFSLNTHQKDKRNDTNSDDFWQKI